MKTNKGFTLIELLVMISIIGVICGIVVATIGRERCKGSAEACRTKTEKEVCLDKIGYISVKDLPAGCLQYVEIPDWYTQTDPNQK